VSRLTGGGGAFGTQKGLIDKNFSCNKSSVTKGDKDELKGSVGWGFSKGEMGGQKDRYETYALPSNPLNLESLQ